MIAFEQAPSSNLTSPGATVVGAPMGTGTFLSACPIGNLSLIHI